MCSGCVFWFSFLKIIQGGQWPGLLLITGDPESFYNPGACLQEDEGWKKGWKDNG